MKKTTQSWCIKDEKGTYYTHSINIGLTKERCIEVFNKNGPYDKWEERWQQRQKEGWSCVLLQMKEVKERSLFFVLSNLLKFKRKKS